MSTRDQPDDPTLTPRDIFELLWRWLFGRWRYRFLTTFLLAGVSLVASPDLLEIVISYILGEVIGNQTQNATLVAQAIGAAMVASSIGLFFFLHRDEARKKAAANAEQVANDIAALIGKLEFLLQAFGNRTVSKPPAYRSDDIRDARELAKRVRAQGPPSLRTNLRLAQVESAGLDASGRNAIFQMSDSQIRGLLSDLRGYLGSSG